MSVPSFPRAEHIALLRQKIEKRLRERNLPLEVSERGLNQLQCQYQFGFRRAPSHAKGSEGRPADLLRQESPAAEDWAELAIHFQVAQRFEEGRGEAELDRILDRFLSRKFGNSS